MNRETALFLVATTEMKPFTKADWMGFSGCESENPLIGENGDYLIIVDGNIIEIFGIDTDQESFKFSVQFLG